MRKMRFRFSHRSPDGFSAVLIAAIIVVIIMPHESGGSPP